MISVCLATFNGEKYISKQIESILSQLNLDDEIVISDDGSTDRTIQEIKDINDSRIKIYFNNTTKGYTNNFQNAIVHSIGDYIFLSDQDDIWNNNKVNVMLNYLSEFDFVTSDAQFVDEDLKSLNQTFFSVRGGRKGFLNNIYISQYLGACMAFKRTILKKLLPFPSATELCPHDLWISLIAEFYFKVKIINEPLILYRRHNNNVSTGGMGSSNSIFVKLKFRMYCIHQIFTRLFV
jgi:glycosyltransferase involved in cell wall biosynthesis